MCRCPKYDLKNHTFQSLDELFPQIEDRLQDLKENFVCKPCTYEFQVLQIEGTYLRDKSPGVVRRLHIAAPAFNIRLLLL
jgi:hypothetical protein